MGDFAKWLLHDDQQGLFEILFGIVATAAFSLFVLITCWLFHKPSLGFQILRGFLLLWAVLLISVAVLNGIHGFFKINLYDHSDAFLISSLLVSCLLQVGWAIYAALSIHRFNGDFSMWKTIAMVVIGLFSCLVSFYAVSGFFQGHLYRFVSLPLALLTFVVTSL